ncbi:MAG: Druantia anti-phage system protein DruA [Solirubrobacteraceae bacterium]
MTTRRFCGRDFTEEELALLRAICEDRQAHPTRSAIARALCEAIDWRDHKGELKEMSARVALLKMAAANLIELPPPRSANNNRRSNRYLSPDQRLFPEPVPQATSLAGLGAVELRRVWTRAESRCWNELVAAHHYLGYVPLCGAQLRYFVEAQSNVIGAVSFGASAWRCQPRDTHIGWEAPMREARLHLVVGNARFLILPGLRVPHLASKILGMATRRLGADWREAYGYVPVLAETFVECGRFAGTSYKAANWICVGKTKGRGKLDRNNEWALPVKAIYLYPLHRSYRQILTAPL